MQEITSFILVELSKELKIINESLKQYQKTRLKTLAENWVRGRHIMQTLGISQRTLQSLRDHGALPHSHINGKFYYKVSGLEKLLEANYASAKPIKQRQQIPRPNPLRATRLKKSFHTDKSTSKI